jgi:hypothetical protein
MRQPLNPSDSNNQGMPPSSGDSTRTQLPTFVVAHGKCLYLLIKNCCHILINLYTLCHRAKAKTGKK